MSKLSAVVTGASRGIGLGIATRLAERGYDLTIAARDETRLAAVAKDLRASGGGVVQIAPGDIADEAYLEALIGLHANRFDSLNALILNAGVGSAGMLADFHPKRFDKQMTLNLRAPFVLLQQALPLLRAAAADDQRGSKVIALASITGRYAESELAVYGAAKAGLMSLCRSVNREEAANGVTATAFAPAYVDTDMAEFKHDVIAPKDMISVADLVELADVCLRLSRRSIVSEIVVARSNSHGYCA
ncbi:SDR family NAD(P)-dependent oxidoreductase [Rhodococcoides fascians]|uniref:SDR family NAD(P)-dependent oxidoreductase n=1 Tax=Rhodococcoides fascians TaxID=1828 RepID=UPI00050C2A68|nr:SDR family oxidoreductase [Rhodococcus fascians]